jgi:hypothetical protein
MRGVLEEKERIRVDRFAVPVLPVRRHAHDLEVQVRRVLRRVPRRADEAEGVAPRNRHPLHESRLVRVEMRIVIHHASERVGRVHRVPAKPVLAHPQDAAAVRREHRRAARRQDVERAMHAATVTPFVEGVLELAHRLAGDGNRHPALEQILHRFLRRHRTATKCRGRPGEHHGPGRRWGGRHRSRIGIDESPAARGRREREREGEKAAHENETR